MVIDKICNWSIKNDPPKIIIAGQKSERRWQGREARKNRSKAHRNQVLEWLDKTDIPPLAKSPVNTGVVLSRGIGFPCWIARIAALWCLWAWHSIKKEKSTALSKKKKYVVYVWANLPFDKPGCNKKPAKESNQLDAGGNLRILVERMELTRWQAAQRLNSATRISLTRYKFSGRHFWHQDNCWPNSRRCPPSRGLE